MIVLSGSQLSQVYRPHGLARAALEALRALLAALQDIYRRMGSDQGFPGRS